MPTTYNGVNTYPASITLPSDGDRCKASNYNPAWSGLADRTTWLHARIGEAYLIKTSSAQGNENADDTLPVTTGGGRTWTGTTYDFTTGHSELISLSAGDAPAAGDIMEVYVNGEAYASICGTGGRHGAVRPFVSENGGGYTKVDGVVINATVSGTASGEYVWPIAWHILWTVTTGGTWKLAVNGRVNNSGGAPSIQFSDTWRVHVRQWRLT